MRIVQQNEEMRTNVMSCKKVSNFSNHYTMTNSEQSLTICMYVTPTCAVIIIIRLRIAKLYLYIYKR